MITQIFAGMVVIVIALITFPIVIEVTNVAINTQTSEAPKNLLKTIPLFFGLGILFVAISIAASAIGNGEEMAENYETDYEEIKKEDPNKKQTYEEYVKERLEIERMLK